MLYMFGDQESVDIRERKEILFRCRKSLQIGFVHRRREKRAREKRERKNGKERGGKREREEEMLFASLYETRVIPNTARKEKEL